MTLSIFLYLFNFFFFFTHPPFKTKEKLILLPKISFKPSVFSLKTTFLWFSEELCVRAKADYFDKPLKNQRSKYSVFPVCTGLWSCVCLHMSSLFHCIVIYLWESRMEGLQGPRSRSLLPLYDICKLEVPPNKCHKQESTVYQKDSMPLRMCLGKAHCCEQTHPATPRAGGSKPPRGPLNKIAKPYQGSS